MPQEDKTPPSYSGLVPEFKPHNMPLEELQTYWKIFDNHCQNKYLKPIEVVFGDSIENIIEVEIKGDYVEHPINYISKGHNGDLRDISLSVMCNGFVLGLENKVFYITEPDKPTVESLKADLRMCKDILEAYVKQSQ